MPNYEKRAVTVTPAVLTTIPTEAFHCVLLKHSDLALLFIQTLALRLHRSWMLGSELAGEDTTLRLVKTLLRYSTSSAARSDGEGVVLKITHAQLAQAVGAVRETVSVCLTDLRQRKLIRTGRNRLHFKPHELRQINDEIAHSV
jgi:CRP/FNR family cyclic AMP-dependent transcriptional regulator